MSKIINTANTVVSEMCRGIVLASPELTVDAKYKIIRRKDINPNKVSLISGGGSGHEPAHAGYVGRGMLDAAVCGDEFASPSQVQIYKAIQETAGKKGTLLIIKNYSGDVMNFKNGAFLAEDEVCVDYVIVNDDIAVNDSLYTVGRRGVAGTVFVHKIAGAAAERGDELAEVKAAAENAIANVRSIGIALTSCTVPAKGTPTFEIRDGEMEYGIGIHGEPGIRREPAMTADQLCDRMTEALASELCLTPGDEVSLLVNGFGATPLQELYVLNNSVHRTLQARGIFVHRSFVGNYMTSLDMAGASLSFMKMNPQIRELLDAPSAAPAFRVDGAVQAVCYDDLEPPATDATDVSFGMRVAPDAAKLDARSLSFENLKFLVDRMGSFIIENEAPFCELDAHAGDGDFGMSIAKGFRQLKREWDNVLESSGVDMGAFLGACALVIMEYCGGASGPIWGSAFRAAGKAVQGKKTLNRAEFTAMLEAALKGIQLTGARAFGRGAEVGDKTLVDALAPCVDAWKSELSKDSDFREAFRAGALAAKAGAAATKQIVARMGRAGTVGERSIGYPDAGAHALGEIFADLAEQLR